MDFPVAIPTSLNGTLVIGSQLKVGHRGLYGKYMGGKKKYDETTFVLFPILPKHLNVSKSSFSSSQFMSLC